MPKVRVKYQTYQFDDIDIHLKTLRDKQQYDSSKESEHERYGISSANWSLFGVIWPSSKVLANYMNNFDIKDKRILELGCGIGLSSHLLNSKGANITATDYNPQAGEFLIDNAKLNEEEKIPFERTSWTDNLDKLGKFDLLIGSDILYETWAIEGLSSFIKKHSNKKCEVIIVDPSRGNHSKFTQAMVALGFNYIEFKAKKTEDYLPEAFKGIIIQYTR